MRGEDRLVTWLRERLVAATGSDSLGDDAARLEMDGGVWAVTVDSQIDGVHHPAGLDPALVARRLLAVNLSDLAACGVEPRWGLLALSAPAGYDRRRFLDSFVAACREHGVTLAGGDLAGTRRGDAVATLTLAGTVPAGGGWLSRGAARPGHRIWVGGTLGESAAGRLLLARGAAAGDRAARWVTLPPGFAPPRPLAAAARRAVRRHLLPESQLDLGLGLALGRLAASRPGAVGGVMDLSDGLAVDLPRLCRESGVGAEIDTALLPLSTRFGDLARRLDADPVDLALTGGEDYALLFTLAEDTAPPSGFDCHPIGRITRRRTLRLRTPEGPRPWPTTGWDHLEG
jgi:thiamine-monophosphate kinase